MLLSCPHTMTTYNYNLSNKCHRIKQVQWNGVCATTTGIVSHTIVVGIK